MGFGPSERPKTVVLTELVTTLARLLTRGGNRVGAILYNNRDHRTIPPRSGRKQVLRLTHELLRESDTPSGATTDLTVLLRAGLNTFARRSLVFVVSDFFSEPGWERPLTILNRRHELVSVRLWDAREHELPDAGLIVVEDAETGEQLYVDTSNLAFRRRFQEAGERREAQLKTLLRRAGVDPFAVSTEESLVGAIVRMATLRKQRRR
jgi:uncharacterized protein (DUF58 family)